MSALRAVLDRLSDLEATVAQIEGASTVKNARAYQATLKSLERRRADLMLELEEVSAREFIEICDYRIIPEGPNSYAVSAVTGALRDFQELVTLLFGVEPSKPRQTAKVSASLAEKTRFDFGFSYAGSLGVVLTVPNDRLIGIETDLDTAVREAFSLLSARTNDDIRDAATKFGPPIVRKLYSWSRTQRDYDLSSEVKWKRGSEIRNRVLVQSRESAEVCRIIENKSDTQEDPLNVVGTLVGFNVATRRFAFEVPDGEVINGTFADDFDASPRTVPQRYQARLTKKTVVRYAIEKDEVSWFLEKLEPVRSLN